MKHLKKISLNLNESGNRKQYMFTYDGYDLLVNYEDFHATSSYFAENFEHKIYGLLKYVKDSKKIKKIKPDIFNNLSKSYNDLMDKHLPGNDVYKLLLDIWIENDYMEAESDFFYNNNKTEQKLLDKAEQMGLIMQNYEFEEF